MFCVGAAAAVALCACAGDALGDTDRTGRPGQAPRAGTGGMGMGAGGALGNFGNTDASVNVPVQMNGGAGGAMAPSDAGPCVVGQFCKPSDPDPDNCGTLEFEPDVEVTRTPGNILVIFDQSMSMEMEWPSTASTKIAAASTAMIAAVTPLQDVLNLGSIFLPQRTCFDPILALTDPAAFSAALNNSVDALADPTQINFMPGPAFLTAWDAHWAVFQTGQLIGTPLQEGFDEAEVALAAATQNGTLTGLTAVVAFTDGEPNCIPDGMGGPTLPAEQHAANWLSRGIKTYVVGLPGANGAQTLTAVAQAGGTMAYIDPSDPAELEMRLREVVEETVSTGFNSCSMNLTPVPDVPDELLMIVDEPPVGEQQVERDQGWSLDVSGGEARIEITGALCEAAMTGRFMSIKFQYACPEAPPPPKLPPIE
jgi:hypothetical protein